MMKWWKCGRWQRRELQCRVSKLQPLIVSLGSYHRTLSGILRLSPRRSVLTLKVKHFKSCRPFLKDVPNLFFIRNALFGWPRTVIFQPEKILIITKQYATDMLQFWAYVRLSTVILTRSKNGCQSCWQIFWQNTPMTLSVPCDPLRFNLTSFILDPYFHNGPEMCQQFQENTPGHLAWGFQKIQRRSIGRTVDIVDWFFVLCVIYSSLLSMNQLCHSRCVDTL